MSVVAKGNEQDKLRFFFTLYDLDGQGGVSKGELRLMLTFVPEGILALAAQQQSKARAMVRSFAFKADDEGGEGATGTTSAVGAAADVAAVAAREEGQGGGGGEGGEGGGREEAAATVEASSTTTSTAPSTDMGKERETTKAEEEKEEEEEEEDEENFPKGASPEFVKGMVEDAFEQCDLNRDGRWVESKHRLHVVYKSLKLTSIPASPLSSLKCGHERPPSCASSSKT